MSIPFYQYKEERNQLLEWAEEKGQENINQYWKDRNETSIDGLNTKFKE